MLEFEHSECKEERERREVKRPTTEQRQENLTRRTRWSVVHEKNCKDCSNHTCDYAPVNGDVLNKKKRPIWRFTRYKGCASFIDEMPLIPPHDTRSHHPAPAADALQCPHLGIARVSYPDGDKNEWCCLNPLTEARKAAIRKDALGEIWKYLLDNGCEVHERGGQKYYVVSGTFSLAGLMQHIESLRSREGEPR